MGKKSPAPPEPSARKPKHKKGDDSTASTDCAGAAVLFWKEDGENGFLCQCAEQYMMWRKAMLFDDRTTAAKIMNVSSPRKQKGLAREIANFDESRWGEERLAVVRRGNWLKFTQCTNVTSLKMDDTGEPVPLKDLLLATKGHQLAEASPFDAVWGIGFKAEEALTVSRARWGENLLGKALMHVRSELEEAASGQTSMKC
ncbi:hypothetical protein B0A55_12995 [Friedmanniomyces simplex]|uniref:NADAR domain-containing protein n=1 Tax=Friedmanniomyces simplex TaxID=329884 RepID=A0A4U0WFU7_9PEZI|nr:hypothetical protein B0A55_12995 [Friedmanniomyces simplex]